MFGLSPCTLNTEKALRQLVLDAVGTTVGLVPEGKCRLDTTFALGEGVAFAAAALGLADVGVVVAASSFLMDRDVGNSPGDLEVVVELEAREQRVSDPLPPESLSSEDGFAPKKTDAWIASHLRLYCFQMV